MFRVLVAIACGACGRVGFDAGSEIDGASMDATAYATPALVREAHNQTGVGVMQLVVAIPATSTGNTLVVAVSGFALVTSIGDSVGNTYVSANVRASDTNTNDTELFVAGEIAGGATAVTVNLAAMNSLSIWVLELDGIAHGNPVVAGKIASNGPSTIAVGPAITTTIPKSVIVAVAGTSASLTGIHTGSPFTNLVQQQGTFTAYDLTVDPGTYTPSWDIGGVSVSAVSAIALAPASL